MAVQAEKSFQCQPIVFSNRKTGLSNNRRKFLRYHREVRSEPLMSPGLGFNTL